MEGSVTVMILAFAFGSPNTTVPNQRILFGINNLENKYAQSKLFTDLFSARPTPITIRNAVEYLKSGNAVGQIYVVAAPPHQARVLRDLSKIAKMEGVDLPHVTSFEFPTWRYSPWFSKDSTQWWTRNRFYWHLYDFFVRLIPFKIYLKMTEKETRTDARGPKLFKR